MFLIKCYPKQRSDPVEEKNLTHCPDCGSEYDAKKNESCPKCNSSDVKRNILMDLSEAAFHMPFGGKFAILLTSCYSVIRISDMVFHTWITNILILILYLSGITFWFRKRDVLEHSIWFLVVMFMLILPITTLIALIVLL